MDKAQLRGLAFAIAEAMPPSFCSACGKNTSGKFDPDAVKGAITHTTVDRATIKALAIQLAALHPEKKCQECENVPTSEKRNG